MATLTVITSDDERECIWCTRRAVAARWLVDENGWTYCSATCYGHVVENSPGDPDGAEIQRARARFTDALIEAQRALSIAEHGFTDVERAFLDGLAAGFLWGALGDIARHIREADWTKQRAHICEDRHEITEIERLVREHFAKPRVAPIIGTARA